MAKFNVIRVNQPIGNFYLAVVPAHLLLNVVRVNQRSLDEDSEGVQRKLSPRRVKEIAQYTRDPDATFPTPIIVACDDDTVTLSENTIEFDEASIIGEVIDGQHRIQGLAQARVQGNDLKAFDLPVVFMLGLEPYEKAYVFSTINSKQTPVPKSLIYDLFALSETRSPYKTAHEVARALNTLKGGPFYQGLKMLGKRNAPTEYLTQGSFVTNLLKRISKNPQADEIAVKKKEDLLDDDSLPFRYYWIQDKDEVIVKILENYFSAIRHQFQNEWNQPTADNFILRKTVGFQALLYAFDEIWTESKARNDASRKFFDEVAIRFRQNLGQRQLTSQEFGSSAAAAKQLSDALLGRGQAAAAQP